MLKIKSTLANDWIRLATSEARALYTVYITNILCQQSQNYKNKCIVKLYEFPGKKQVEKGKSKRTVSGKEKDYYKTLKKTQRMETYTVHMGWEDQ